MKERPILMNGAMARAALAGTKTLTCRIVKLPHMNPLGQWEPTTIGGEHGGRTKSGESIPLQGGIWHTRTGDCLICPYGAPGDRLFVRETFAPHSGDEMAFERWAHDRAGPKPELFYAADEGEPYITRWRPSIHMPRWACRPLLEIVSVRVERLHSISTADIIAEGLSTTLRGHDAECDLCDQWRALWESTGGDWAENPWVWCLTFKRVTP